MQQDLSVVDDISEFVFLFAGKKQHYIGLCSIIL